MTDVPDVQLRLWEERDSNSYINENSGYEFRDVVEVPFNAMYITVPAVEYDGIKWEVEDRYFSVDKQQLVLKLKEGHF